MKSQLPQDTAKLLCLPDMLGERLGYAQEYDAFYEWIDLPELPTNGYWRRMTYPDVERLLFFNIDSYWLQHDIVRKPLTSGYVKDIIYMCKKLLKYQFTEENYNFLALNDSWLNLSSLALCVPDKTQLVSYHLPYHSVDLLQRCPLWLDYLNATLIDDDLKAPDAELLTLVQEMFGFFFLNDFRNAKAFFLVGSGSNGKTVMTTIIREMLGSKFCTAMTLEELTTNRFKIANLIGARVNICNEEESERIHTAKLKELVTADSLMSAEIKFGASFTFQPRVKFLFATNDMPIFDKVSFGLRRRVMIIPFSRRFLPTDPDFDVDILSKLLAELPGIIGWAIQGAKNLRNRNMVFTTPRVSQIALGEMEADASSSIAFFHERFTVGDPAHPVYMDFDELYREYAQWCIDCGKLKRAKNGLTRDLRTNIDGFKAAMKHTNSGNAVNITRKVDAPPLSLPVVEQRDRRLPIEL